MAHTYTQLYLHCIFSTRERAPSIDPDRMPALCAYLSGIATKQGFALLTAGGTANHLHLLLSLPAEILVATAMQSLKGNSSRWMGASFHWQQGYGAFSVSPSQLPAVKAYIRGQEEHHRKQSFEEEFTQLLRSCGVEYDPRFVFG